MRRQRGLTRTTRGRLRTGPKYARTDYANANKYAMAAEMAATAAEMAATAAMNANRAAAAANQAAMGAATSGEAQAERDKAKMQKMMSKEEHDTAIEKKGDAMMALGKAMRYEGMHVIGLLQHANAQDLDLGDPEDVDLAASIAKAKKARLMAVSMAVHGAAGMPEATTPDADNDSSTTDGSGDSTATATFPADTPDDEDTATVDEAMAGNLSIAVDPDGGGGDEPLTFRTEAVEDDPDTDADESAPKTATMLMYGLGDFGHGYQITDDGTHVIVFTDKMQGTPEVAAVAFVSERAISSDSVTGNTVTDLGTKSGTGYTGVTYYEGSVADDTDPATAFMGTLTCPDGTECSAETDQDGDITVTGFTFTGSREERAAVTGALAAENDDYLAFGVWLQEDANGGTEGTPKAFGAFHGGGQAVESSTYSAALTGTAAYTGKAAGVYTAGSSVDYFEGNASLTANFGEEPETGPDTSNGTIKGMIDGIMAGGVSMSDEIRLSGTAITDDGDFSGNARMGAGEIQDNDSVKYPYNGSWSGNFYGPATDDDATEDVTEGPANTAPAAAAGTFGVSGTMGEGDDAVTRSYVGAFGARNDD